MAQDNIETYGSNASRKAGGQAWITYYKNALNDFKNVTNEDARAIVATHCYDIKKITLFNKLIERCELAGVRFFDVPAFKSRFKNVIPGQIKKNVLRAFNTTNMGLMADANKTKFYDEVANNNIKVLARDDLSIIHDLLLKVDGCISIEGHPGTGKDFEATALLMNLVETKNCYLLENTSWQKCIRAPENKKDDGEWIVDFPPRVQSYSSIPELLLTCAKIRVSYPYSNKPVILVLFSELVSYLSRLRSNTKLGDNFKICLNLMRKWGIHIVLTGQDWNEFPKRLTGTKTEDGVIKCRIIKSTKLTKKVNELLGEKYHCESYSELSFVKIIEKSDDRISNEIELENITHIYQSNPTKWNTQFSKVKAGEFCAMDKSIDFFEKTGTHYDGSPFNFEHFLNSFKGIIVQKYDEHVIKYFETCGEMDADEPVKEKTPSEKQLILIDVAIQNSSYPDQFLTIFPYEKLLPELKTRWKKRSSFKSWGERRYHKVHDDLKNVDNANDENKVAAQQEGVAT